MARLPGHESFDADEHEPDTGMGALPADWYRAAVIESETKATRAGTGHYLKVTFLVTEGDYKNRRFWQQYNLDNPNAEAVRIARAQFSSLCRAVGVRRVSNSEELHGREAWFKLGVKQSEGYDPQNKILETRNLEGELPKATASSSKESAAEPAKAKMPWQR